MFVDTNVVANAKRGVLPSNLIRGARISSVVASELLLVYGNKRTIANYYVPLSSSRGGSTSRPFVHRVSRGVTDQIVFSFGKDYESFIEFGSHAITKLVNERNEFVLQRSIAFLDKSQKRYVKRDFDFLIANDIGCVALNPLTIHLGYRLLDQFTASQGRMKTTFRDTWNDLLILATAWAHNDELYSKDDQLNRFAAQHFGTFNAVHDGFLKIRFPEVPLTRPRKQKTESKEYINRGWRAMFTKGTPQAW